MEKIPADVFPDQTQKKGEQKLERLWSSIFYTQIMY